MTLSPSDSVGPVGPYGMLSPFDSDSVGPYGMLSPCDSDSVGPYGTLSPSDSDSVGPYGTLSPCDSDSVGPYGTLSPSDSVAVGHVGPDGMMSSSDLAGILFPAVPTGMPFPVGPVGPYGTLSPSVTTAVGPDGTLSSSDLAGILFPAIPAGIPSPVGHVGMCETLSWYDYKLGRDNGSAELPSLMGPAKTLGTVSPSDPWARRGCCPHLFVNAPAPWALLGYCPRYDGTGLVQIAPTGELLSVEAVPFPGKRNPNINQLPAEMLVGDCGEVGSRDVPGISCRTVPGGLGDPAVVAMIGLDVMPMGERIQLHRANMNAEWDIRDEFETIDGMPVDHGGDLCDSDKSDWEDPCDIAYAEEVDLDALDGIKLKVFERLKRPDDSVLLVEEQTVLTQVRRTSSSRQQWQLDTLGVKPVADILNEMHDVPDEAVSAIRRSCSETYGGGTDLYSEEDISGSDCGSVESREWILGKTGVTLHLEMDTVPFHRIRMIRCRRWCSGTNCFQLKTLPICMCRIMRNCLCQHYRFSWMKGGLWSHRI